MNNISTARQITRLLTDLMEDRYGDIVEPVANCGDRKLEIDMSVVKFLSSVGLNELIHINRQAKVRGIEIILAGVQPQVRDIFVLTRLERMFKFQNAQAPNESPETDSSLRAS